MDWKNSFNIGYVVLADAEVTARVSAPKRQTEEKRLLHVPLGGEIAYGNFFRMRQDERYRIELMIRRAGSAEAVTAGLGTASRRLTSRASGLRAIRPAGRSRCGRATTVRTKTRASVISLRLAIP